MASPSSACCRKRNGRTVVCVLNDRLTSMATHHDLKSIGDGGGGGGSVPWSIALSFRSVTPTDSIHLKAVTSMLCSDIAHVDLLFRSVCPGSKLCKYRGINHIPTSPAHEKGRMHVVAYSIRNTSSSYTVTCAVEPAFHKECAWTIVGIQAKPKQISDAEDFLISQLGRAYNTAGYQCNWLLGWCGIPCGTSKLDVFKLGFDAAASHHWFCSELVSAALLRGGIIKAIDSRVKDPCITRPQDVYNYTKFVVTTAFAMDVSDVWPEVPRNDTSTMAAVLPLTFTKSGGPEGAPLLLEMRR